MANYHLSLKTVGRSSGRSATAAAAYRSGEMILDQRTGLVHDYRRRSGVVHTEIFAPSGAPDWARDRATLWNQVEFSEHRKNSTVAREFEISLPAELSGEQRRALAAAFAQELVDRHNLVADVAIHAPGRDGDNRNHHAHILCSTRRLTEGGFTEKTRELDVRHSGEIQRWRERWATLSNAYLAHSGQTARVDHRSLADQRAAALERGDLIQAGELDRRPTIYLGPALSRMMARGEVTDRGERQRAIQTEKVLVTELADVRRQIAVNDDRAAIEQAWQAELGRQAQAVARQVQRALRTAQVQRAGHEKHIAAHTAEQPEPPGGLFARFRQASYEAKRDAWQRDHDELAPRFEQLQARIQRIEGYTFASGPHGLSPAGQLLAQRRAARAQPGLARAHERVVAAETAEREEADLGALHTWRQQAAALGAAHYEANGGDEAVSGSAEEIAARLPALRRAAARGETVRVRPTDERRLYLTIEVGWNDLEALRAAGYRPALVQQTGPDAFQAVMMGILGDKFGLLALPEYQQEIWRVVPAFRVSFSRDLAIGDVSIVAADGVFCPVMKAVLARVEARMQDSMAPAAADQDEPEPGPRQPRRGPSLG